MLRDLGWLKKVKIWDGENVARITSDKYLTIKGYGTVKFNELFEDNTIDIVNKWIEVITGNANKTLINTHLFLNVTTDITDSISYTAKQKILPSTGQSWNNVLWVLNTELSSDNNNITEWGVLENNNGFLFRLQGNTLKAVSILNGVETTLDLSPLTYPFHKYIIRRTGLTEAQFIIDDVKVGSLYHLSGSHLVGNKYDTLYVASRNIGTLSNPITREIVSCAVIDEASSGIEIVGIDSDGLKRNVALTNTGRLLVSQEPPTAPPETKSVIKTEYGEVSVQHDNDFVIPNGEILIIQRFSAGAEPAGGSNVELWYDPDGTKANMEIIDTIFSDGQSDQHDLNEERIGDGIAQIVMRRTGIGSSNARLIFGRWEGYY